MTVVQEGEQWKAMKGGGMAPRVTEYSRREETIAAKRTMGRLIDIDLNEQAVRFKSTLEWHL